MNQQFSYSDIIKTISEQVSLRKGALFKRSLAVSMPLIIAFTLLTNESNLLPHGSSDFIVQLYYIAVAILFVIGLLWAFVASRIFRIERAIWIDSYFDGVDLTTKQSWKISRKLFWPNVLLSLNVFLRYYLPLLILWIAIIIGLGGLISNGIIEFNLGWYVGIIVGIPISFLLYSFYVKIRLRYLVFTFLDLYGLPEFSYSTVFKKAVAVNKATKGDAFQKTLVVMLGSEALEYLTTSFVNSSVRWSTSRMGNTGKAVGDVAGFATSEVVAALRSYTQDITYYIYYQAGLSVLYGVDQRVVNQEVYRLGQ